MERDQSIKIKFFTIVIFLLSGLALLYFDYNKKNNNTSFQSNDKTITVIDLSDKSSDFSIPLILGIVLISIAVLLTLQTFLLNPAPSPPTPTLNLRSKISKQEQKVVSLIEQGKTNKEIAIELSISTSTVKTHINNIFKKVGVTSRDELLQKI